MSPDVFQFVLGLRSVVLARGKSSGKTCAEVFFNVTNLLMCDQSLRLRVDSLFFLPRPLE